MKNNYIYKHIRKSSILGIILAILVLSAILMLYIILPFREVLSPKEIPLIHQISYAYSNDVEYIEITLNDIHYTGYDSYRHGKVYASYYYSLSNNSCTLILVKNVGGKLPDILNNYTIRARLIENDSHSSQVIEQMADDLNWTKEGLKSITSDITIDETAFKSDTYMYLAITLGVIGIIIFSYLLSNIAYAIIPAIHPSCIYFRRLTKDRKTIENVNNELRSNLIIRSGNTALTKNYIVRTTPFNIEIIPITRIVWAYEHSTWHHILWFKTKLTYTLSILYGYNIHIDSYGNTKEHIDTIIEYLSENYPGIILGYTPENKISAKKKAAIIYQHNKAQKKK